MTRRNPGGTWLVVLRADALEDWLKANHPGIQRKGPKGYKSLCNSDTSLIAYLRWCTHGVEIGAVDRAFVVSAATGSEAALKGLKEFNAATVRMYQPLLSMAIERVLPGPVYVAEIYDRETSAVEYEPFTPASKDEMLRGVQERASQYDEGFDLKVAAFNRAPATLGRRFIEGTAENIDFARNRVDMSEVAADDARDQMDEVSGMAAGPGFAVGLPQAMWSPAMMKAYAKGDENAFDQAYLELKSRARTEEHADQVRKSMLPELSKADMQRKLTGNPYKVVIPLVSGIAYLQNARRNPSSSSELYHATLSGKNDEIVLSMIDGIDSGRAQGFGQGQGFYRFTHRKEAVNHARGLVSGRGFAKEVKVEGEPIIVVVDAPLTPENYDADYEVSAADFRRFLFEHKDWIRDNADKLGLVFGPAYTSTSRFSPNVISVPDRITLTTTGKRTVNFSITAEPLADETPNTRLAQHLSILAQRIAAVSPELLLQFEESTLKTMPAVKYVGPKIQPARIERPDGTVIWRRDVRSNPRDLEGRYIPDRYLAGLPPTLQKQRIGELTQSRDDYKLGDYSELPTDRIARKMGLVKQSQYTTEAKIRGIEYRGDLRDMAKRVMVFYGHRATSGEVQQFADALRKSFAKGLAAWKSGGHRPGATAQNWAVARVNSLVVGGKTSWTADKKLFEVLPAAVRAKIESMRAKQNPIEVEVRGTSKATKSGPHTRFFQSESALARIVEQGKEVVPRIKFIVDWGAGRSNKRGTPGVVTLISRADRLQEGVDSLQKMFPERSSRVSLYTAHTILHRLGDAIMPKPLDIRWMPYRSAAVRGVPREDLVVTGRAEAAYRKLGPVLIRAEDHLGGEKKLDKWLPTVVDTKACREGWIVEGDQALAELVPYRLLYEKGRKNGVKLLSTLPFVPELESTLTEYIDAMMDMLVGHEVMI